ncbi:phage holin family protein [Williamsia phyllosphaerae]|uniref:Uncharacterized protein n=1 Tax=Williamsia phyllosphaerae TaxID=885042 RepID=A0ABQ1UXI3_9NOCA|nr:phage holin family protein [Williamsia phyllosphaerae]GGF29606.1 hypothetical protein GCM10007298_26920 [Williamsia phyllosphaerae]
MLVMALAATLVGFGLLVVALITGTLWLAVACIAVCIVGGVFLLADLLGVGHVLTIRRSRHAGATDSSVVDPAVGDADRSEAGESTRPDDPSDNEITTEFPRTLPAEPTVTLDDPGSAWHADIADSPAYEASTGHRHSAPENAGDDPASARTPSPSLRHGRHESPDDDDARPRTPRHGGS